MSVIEIDKFVEPCSAADPCGPNLEYDPAFLKLDAVAREAPEQEPDWKEVRRLALELGVKTRDLRIAVTLSRALLETDAWPGLEDGLTVVQGLVSKHWDAVHPRLDPTDDNDPQMRVNVLVALKDSDTMLRAIRRTPFVGSRRSSGAVTLRDVLIAEGKLSAPPAGDTPLPSQAEIDSLLDAAGAAELQDTDRALDSCVKRVRDIEAALMTSVGSSHACGFDPLLQVLEEVRRPLAAALARRGLAEAPAADGDRTRTAKAVSITGEIASREDAVRMLDRVCEYFDRNEPSSPVPILLRRAKRLVSKSFVDIVRDLAPEGLPQVENIRGASQE